MSNISGSREKGGRQTGIQPRRVHPAASSWRALRPGRPLPNGTRPLSWGCKSQTNRIAPTCHMPARFVPHGPDPTATSWNARVAIKVGTDGGERGPRFLRGPDLFRVRYPSVVLAVLFSSSDAASAVAPILKRTSAKRKSEQWPYCGMIEPEWVPDRGAEKAS
jgi:hypothetical protein